MSGFYTNETEKNDKNAVVNFLVGRHLDLFRNYIYSVQYIIIGEPLTADIPRQHLTMY